MFKKFKSHIQDNAGDSNVSKMVIVATSFVVGAILLIMVSSAFQGPIHTWFSNVTEDWFKESTGSFGVLDNTPWGKLGLKLGTYEIAGDGYYMRIIVTESGVKSETNIFSTADSVQASWAELESIGGIPDGIRVLPNGNIESDITIDGVVAGTFEMQYIG